MVARNMIRLISSRHTLITFITRYYRFWSLNDFIRLLIIIDHRTRLCEIDFLDRHVSFSDDNRLKSHKIVLLCKRSINYRFGHKYTVPVRSSCAGAVTNKRSIHATYGQHCRLRAQKSAVVNDVLDK